MPSAVDTFATACESFTWYDSTYTVTPSAAPFRMLTNAAGCDSVVTLRLTINHSTTGDTAATACNSFVWYGQSYTESGEYTHTLVGGNAAGCDSVVTLHLTVNPLPSAPALTVENNTSCEAPNASITVTAPVGEGYTYSINGVDYQTSTLFSGLGAGTYTITVKNSNGCTNSQQGITIVTVGSTLNIDTVYSTSPCEGGDLVLYVETNTTDVTYSWTGPNEFTSTEQNPVLHNVITDNAGAYTVTVKENVTNCTATRSTEAVVLLPTTGSETAVACESYLWHDSTYTASTDTAFWTTMNAVGCDSVVTLHLTINHPQHLSYTVTEFDTYTWQSPEGNGTTYTASGTYFYEHTDANGCTQMDTLYLTIYYSSSNEFSATACESYTWDGREYTASGDYSWEYTDIHGADSMVTMHLTIYHGTHNVETKADACESYEWHGVTYTTSGVYSYEYMNDKNCPSADTLYLTVNYGTHNVFTMDTCNTYTWHSQEYTTSGDKTFEYTNSDGCPSVDTLKLTIYKMEAEMIYVNTNDNTNCEGTPNGVAEVVVEPNSSGYRYSIDGGVTFQTSNIFSDLAAGTHTIILEDPNGCRDTISATVGTGFDFEIEAFANEPCEGETLKLRAVQYPASLTVNYAWECLEHSSFSANDSVVVIDAATAVDHNGTYKVTATELHSGCSLYDIVTVNVKQPTTGDTSAIACESFTWYGETYTTSGDFTHTF